MLNLLFVLTFLRFSQQFDKIDKTVFFEIRDASSHTLNPHSKAQFFESSCPSYLENNKNHINLDNLNHDLQCSSPPHHLMRFSSDNPPKKLTFSSIKRHFLNENLSEFCEDPQILSLKSYWRHGGYLPTELAKKEIRRANQNKDHIPDFFESLEIAGYLFSNEEVPSHRRIQIKHELLGLCVSCNNSDNSDKNSSFHHFILDRNANAQLPEVWNTKIRLIYIGEGEDCHKNDEKWAEKRTKGLNLRAESYGLEEKGYSLNMVIKDIQGYFKQFPKYNALYNCQHFANNLYNKISGKEEQFISKEIMIFKERRKEENNENKLFFDFQ